MAQPVRLTSAQLELAVAMLVRAFQDYPLSQHFFPSAGSRPRRLACGVRCLLHYGLAVGEVYASSTALEGVAMWLPAGRRLGLGPLVRIGTSLLTLGAGPEFIRRLWSFYRHVAKCQQRHMTIPHWYLQLLGVDPAHQRCGHARRLLETVLQRLDEERLACFLDTEDAPNVRFYEQFGFRVLEVGRLPGSDVDCWFMGRPKA